MKYIAEILWLISWPTVIYVSLLLSQWVIRKLEGKLE